MRLLLEEEWRRGLGERGVAPAQYRFDHAGYRNDMDVPGVLQGWRGATELLDSTSRELRGWNRSERLRG